MILLKDYETRSRLDLAEVGQHRYAKDPSTEILCLGWKVIGEAKNNLITYAGIYTDDPSETKEYYYALKHCKYVVAHNAPFEQAIYNFVESKTTPMAQKVTKLFKPHDTAKYYCTMAGANVMGLPSGLEKLAQAIGLPHKKDTEGRKLMLKMCKPRTTINRKTNLEEWLEWVLGDENLIRLGEYCKTDLAVEEGAFNYQVKYGAFTKFERNLWVLDQIINQRGFRVDMPFIEAARTILKTNEGILNEELLRKTLFSVRTVKSTKSLKEFISSQGYDLPNVQKATVDNLLKDLRVKAREGDKDLIEVLEIREELGLSSTSKYEAFYQRADRSDMRVRDNLLFSKSHTGRWAGTGVQPQNFPRGSVKVKPSFFADFKDFAAYGEDAPEIAKIFYPRLTATLSSMLRGGIIATEGKKLYVGDFASIEARVLLWCAGDEAGLVEYRKGLDTYITMAATVYRTKYEIIFKGYAEEDAKYMLMRQLGKQIILACLAPNTKVLTQRGWVNIIDIREYDLVYDGVEWVKHEGVICRGQKQTIKKWGVRLTPDHKILTPSGWLAACQALDESIIYPAKVLSMVRLPLEDILKANGAAWLRLKLAARVVLKKFTQSIYIIYLEASLLAVIYAQKKRLPRLILNTALYLTRTASAYITASRQLLDAVITPKIKTINFTALEALRFLKRGAKTALYLCGIYKHLEAGIKKSLSLIGAIRTVTTSLITYASSLKKQTSIINVYDLVNAGPRNRFTILTDKGPIIVHNCGYGMGLKKFTETVKANGINLPESTIMYAHKAFKEKYPLVPKLWFDVERAAIGAVKWPNRKFKAGRCIWAMKGDFLVCSLPSGRNLWYYKPEIQPALTSWGETKDTLFHWGIDQKTRQWTLQSTYGGKLVENIVQAISRDCMANSMVLVEANGYEIVLTVHDELITENSGGSVEDFKYIMSTPPDWGQDIPLKVGAWSDIRYRK